jgi:hypothetical protein
MHYPRRSAHQGILCCVRASRANPDCQVHFPNCSPKSPTRAWSICPALNSTVPLIRNLPKPVGSWSQSTADSTARDRRLWPTSNGRAGAGTISEATLAVVLSDAGWRATGCGARFFGDEDRARLCRRKQRPEQRLQDREHGRHPGAAGDATGDEFAKPSKGFLAATA